MHMFECGHNIRPIDVQQCNSFLYIVRSIGIPRIYLFAFTISFAKKLTLSEYAILISLLNSAYNYNTERSDSPLLE